MTGIYYILAYGKVLLRIGFVLALFVMLNIPHSGMAAMASTPAMTLHHTADPEGETNPSGGLHDKMNGALCAMLCTSADRVGGPSHPARVARSVFMQWAIVADPVWPSYHPDPDQRPPDTAPDA